MKRKIKSVLAGMFLLTGLFVYYLFCSQNKGKLELLDTQSDSESVQFVLDDGKNILSEDVNSYYSGVKVLTKEKFQLDQCRGVNESIYFVQDNHVPMLIRTKIVCTKERLNQDELESVWQTVKTLNADKENWKCFLADSINPDRKISQEELEKQSKYAILDITLQNLRESETIFNLQELKMILVNEDRTWDKDFYTSSDRSLVSNIVSITTPVLISADQQIFYVGTLKDQKTGKIMYYREQDRSKAALKNSIYIDGEIRLRMMFVCTDDEIETGRLALCSDQGNAGKNGQFTNQGFVIDLGEEIKNAADHQSGDE